MKTTRLEAFSDGVLAIVITIMVLELKPPEGEHFSDLLGSSHALLTYLLSFTYVGIYWNNHHHAFQVAERVDGRVLWANLNLLFWLSLIPFTTSWIDDTKLATTPVVVYGVNLLLAGLAFAILQRTLLRLDHAGRLAAVIADDRKGRLSPVLYLAGILASLVNVWIGMAFYVLVALMWIVPDPRMERAAISD